MPLDEQITNLAQREVVRAIIFRQLSRHADLQFLSVYKMKHDGTGYWETPKGGVKEHERQKAALFREIQEETGLFEVEILARQPTTQRYFAMRNGVETFITAHAYPVLLKNPHARVIIGSQENHARYKWDTFENTARLLWNPQYPEQQSGFIEVCTKANLVPREKHSYASSAMIKPTKAQMAAYGNRH